MGPPIQGLICMGDMQSERTSTEGTREERKARYKPQSTLHNVQTIWKSIPCIKIHCKPTVLDLIVHIAGKENPTSKNANQTQHPLTTFHLKPALRVQTSCVEAYL